MSRSRRYLRPTVAAITAVVASVIGTGCASTDKAASDRALAVLQPPPATSSTAAPTADASNCTASLRPEGVLPAPMQMPAATFMAEIQSRNTLRVGVDQNTLFFGYRNPRINDLEGFDIDVAKEIARAIFGDPAGHIEYVVVSTSQRIPAVAGAPAGQNVKVDIVASLMTMRCSRWNDVSFSSQYYAATQGLLVRRTSAGEIAGPVDLANKRVCATRGSTSSSRMQQLQPQVKMLEVANRTECLVALQDGRVDAITADDTILYGFKKQDPTTVILPVRLGDEPYGLAMNKAHPDFVRFVNGVLEQRRADDTLSDIADHWSREAGVDFPPIPDAQYRD